MTDTGVFESSVPVPAPVIASSLSSYQQPRGSFVDESAEYRLLGALVDHPDIIRRVTEALFTQSRVAIFRAMKEAYMHYGEIASEGVERFLGTSVPHQVEVARGSRPSAIIDHLADLATKRQFLEAADFLTRSAAAGNLDRESVLKNLRLAPILVQEDSSLSPGVDAFLSDLRQKKSGQYRFVDTGIPFLNYMLGKEWPRQALTVVMGQPGGGKTALVCQSILRMALMGIPSLFLSLEMPKPRIISRFVATLASVDGTSIRSGEVSDDEQARIDEALSQIQSLPIYIVDRPGMSVESIVDQVRMHKELYGVEAFFVDYLQIVSRNLTNTSNDSEELGYITQSLRNVAVETETACVALSQKNRQHSGLAGILGSGRISQIADTVFEIEMAETADADSRGAMFNVLKNRDGPLGSFPSMYRPKYLYFT